MSGNRWWKNRNNKARPRRPRKPSFPKQYEPRLEALEPRWLPSTFTVTNTGDSGTGSLRAAITSANASPGSTINFNVGPSGVVQTITPASALPAVTASVTIDGTTEPGYTGSPLINLNGAGLNANGLQITASNTTVRGLAVGGFGQAGLLISGGATGDLIANDFIGTNAAGTAAVGNPVGVEISNSANNTLNTDLISGNSGNGVTITGGGSTGNVVVNCKIGTNAAGTAALGNGGDGVDVQNGASGNTVGAAAGQPVSTNLALWLNADQGVTVDSSGQVTGWADQSGNNHNGALQGSGLTLVTNAFNGHNTVQFTGAGDLLLSGQVLTSQQYTILAVVTDTHTDANFHEVFSDWAPSNGITSVFLGTTNNAPDRARFTDYMGGAVDPNHTQTGVGSITSPTQPFVLTGVSSTGDASVYQDQTLIADNGSAVPTRNLNFAYSVGNQGSLGGEYWQGDISELLVYNGALSQAQLAADWSYLQGKYLPNVISGNAGNGVSVHDSGTTGNVVEGNQIGTNAGGTAKLANAFNGVAITNGASANTVGGAAAAARNIISGNTDSGVYVGDTGTSGNVVEGNFIGTDLTGTVALANGNYGVVTVASSDTTIGGTSAQARNILSGNSWGGIGMFGGSSNNLVEGNFIGTDVTGTRALGNALRGVAISSCAGNTVGGTSAGARNIISGNGWDGVSCEGSSVNNVIEGNYIGTDVTGGTALGNLFSGVVVFGTASDNQIGGAAPGAGNLISANGTGGISIFSGSNLIGTNHVGTDVSGTASLANGGDAILFVSSAGNNTLGGTAATTITLNAGGVVEVDAPSTVENLSLAGNGLSVNVVGGLTLYGTLNLGAPDGSTNDQVYFSGNQALSGSGTVLFGQSASNALYARGDNGSNPATLTIGSGITVQGGSGIISGYYGNDSIVLNGAVAASTSGETVTLGSGGGGNTLTNFRAITASNGATISIPESLQVNGSSIVTVSAGSSLTVGGNLLGTTQNPALFKPQGTITLNATATVPTFNTGVGASGQLLAAGSVDPHYTLVASADTNAPGPSSYVVAMDGLPWVPDGPNSEWIAPETGASAGEPVGLYKYETTVDLTGFDPATAVLSGQFSTDNELRDLLVNGVSTGTNNGTSDTHQWASWTSYTISSGFHAGVNTLDFVVNNDGGPTGFRNEMSMTAARTLEATSADLGSGPAGFTNNFAYGTLVLGSNSYVKLVNQSVNSPGSAAEAVYANALVVPAGSTLNLNGLHLYVRDAQVAGTITGGSMTSIPDSGPLTIGSATPGSISAAGQLDNWTFFARAGHSITVALDPGSGAPGGPISPQLQWGQVQLLDSSNNVLASASSTSAGAILTLKGVLLPADGTYTIAVSAAPSHASSTGNYVVAAYDVTPNVQPLNVNQTVTGTIATPYSTDQWTFSAAGNTQVQFNLLAESASGLRFSLTGPNGFSGFTNATGSSGLITLPTSGTYTLTAQGTGGAMGSYAFEMTQTIPTTLTLGTPYQVGLAGSGQAQLFAVTVGAANPLEIKLTDANQQDHNEVYVSFGRLPTRDSYDYRFTGGAAANQTAVLTAKPGTYYVLVYNNLVKGAGSYTIEADSAPFLLSGMTPGKIGNAHDTTLQFSGVFPLQAGNGGYVLSTAPYVQLIDASGNVYPGLTLPLKPPPFGTVGGTTGGVNPDGTMTVSAVVPGGLVLPGTYSVRVTDNSGYSQTLANALTVVQGGLGILKTNVIAPNPIGFHVAATIYVQYSNVGDAPMAAPLLVLTATQNGIAGALLTLDQSKVVSGFWTSSTPDGYAQSVQFLASGSVPGILQPGETESVPVYYAGWLRDQWDFSRPPINFSLGVLDNTNTQAIDWASLQTSLRPPSLSQAAWNALYPNLTAQLGPTWGAYVQQLDNDAQYLAGLGEKVTDIGQLFSFEVQQGNGYSPLSSLASATDAQVAAPGLPLSLARTFSPGIVARNQFGRFGWGWSDSWDTSLTVDADGSVNVFGPAGSLRRFQPDSRGGYFAQPGDHGTLAKVSGGGYTLTELNGQVAAYSANGTLNYVQDANGNRITASYANGLLTRLSHSSGQFLALTYNSAGLVSSITDSAGRTTAYTYDPSSQYLTSVVYFDNQTTGYTYDQGSNPATAHALLSVTHSDGSHDFFSYDARGRLADAHRDGGAEDTTFTYSEGQVAGTDAVSETTRYFFDNRGLLVQVENPLENTVHYAYDNNFNLTRTTDAAGQVYTNTYDAFGDLLSSTDSLGHTVNYVYQCAFDRLAAVRDGNGNRTLYGYDGKGNLTSTTYADGTVESVAYDPVGNVLSSKDRKGQVTKYTHDAAGNILTETFADGSQVVFTYDAHENLTSATDSAGTTVLTYDANDRLIQITYPSGHYLKFSYDEAGRRTQMVDDTAFTVNYGYDSLGRLASLTDGSGNLIVRYTYDTVGRPSREDKGNGTYTTYENDAAGELLHLVNYAPDGTVNSRFDYSYDSLGRRITEATVDGTWNYSYDAIGELTHAVFVSSNPAIANQDLAYSYNAAGNRTQTVINGVTTVYTTNNLNEYTQVGDTTYNYNVDGAMTSVTNASGTTAYAYNVRQQLVGVTGASGSWAYQYDAFGNRVAETQNGQTTQYVIDPAGLGNVVAIYNSSGLVGHYTYGSELVSSVAPNSGTLYYDFDGLGSTVGLSNPSGGYVNNYSYLPFGDSVSVTQTVATPFQFGGGLGVMSDTNGIQLMRARFMLPGLGRFLSRDTMGSPSSNPYTYAGNAPVNAVDPSGFDTFWIGSDPVIDDPNTSTFPIDQWPTIEQDNKFYGEIFFNEWGKAIVQDTKLAVIYGVGTIISDGIVVPAAGKLLTSAGLAAEDAGILAEITGSLVPGIKSIPTSPEGAAVESFKLLFEILRPPDPPATSLGPPDSSTSVNSTDPNSKIGPAGYGVQDFVNPANSFPYRIDFENAPAATAPAQRVDVTDQLDPDLDWSSFQWTGFGFGNTVIAVPPNTQHYETTLPMTFNGVTFRVVVDLNLDPQTGKVTASFQSLNAATLMTGLAVCPGTLPLGPVNPFADLPPDVTVGFLPPEDGTGRGMGYLTYTVRPNANLSTGTRVRNVADVTFDLGNTIATDQVSETDPSQGIDPNKEALVTIDAGAPTSAVAALPAVSSTTAFTVSWSGTDDPGGSGVASFTIYSSDNGARFTPWLTATTQTSATFTGVNGHTYGFYSIATDNVGNIEAAKSAAEATTLVQTQVTTTTALTSDHPSGSTYGQAVTFTATVSAADTTFGTPTGSVQFQVDGAAFGASVPLSNGTATLTTATLSAAPHQVTAVYTSNSSSFLGSTTASPLVLNVAPAPLTVSANGTTKVYGTANPAFTATYSGFVLDQDAGVLGGSLTFSTTATAASHAGSYAVTPGGLTATNYAITFVAGTLTVTPAPLTITADSKTKVYGAPLPSLTASYAGFVNGDTAASLTAAPVLSTTATAGSHVVPGGYAITVGGAADPDYNISYSPGTLTVTPAPLTITADNKTMVYGGTLPALTASYTGLVNGDTPSSLPTPPTLSTVPATSHVGTYDITPSAASDPDYAIGYVTGTLTITPAPLAVTADNKTRVYGQPNPTLTASYSGFVNGDTAAVLGGSPSLATDAALFSPPGMYTITAGPGSLADPDYTFNPVNGTLTVTKAATASAATASAPTPLFGVDSVTFTTTVSVTAPGSGSPTGSVDFVDVTTGTDLGSAPLVNGSAALTTGSLAVGTHTVTATYGGDANFLSSAGSASLEVIPPASLSGLVFEDFNDDGQVDFGENGIAGVAITLAGTDDLGHAVSRSQTTDADGTYSFDNLRPGSYTLTETQPAGYTQGTNTVGTWSGTARGSISATDQFFVAFGKDDYPSTGVNGINYNYGERPAATGAVQKGQTAGIGFWNNKNGQALIKALNGGTGTQLGDWLAATLPNMYGKNAGANNLAGKSNADVASFFQSLFSLKGPKVDAQVLATALSVYVTNATLDSTGVGTQYGFTVSGDGVGTATVNVGSSGDAFGVANNATLTVMDLLLATNAQAVNGTLYNGDTARRNEANDVYSTLNDAGGIS